MSKPTQLLLAGLIVVTGLVAACATGSVTGINGSAGDPNADPSTLPPGTVLAESRGILGGPNNQAMLVGRFDMTDPNAPVVSFAQGKISAAFTGTSLGVMLADSGYDSLNVQIDNNPNFVLSLNVTTQPTLFPLATNLPDGNHTVTLTKRTEPLERDQVVTSKVTGSITFAGFVLGTNEHFLHPPATATRLIEAVGDSGYNGYGVEGGNSSCSYTVGTQNGDLSVPGFAARTLQSEVSNLAISGKGIYNSPYDPNDFNSMLPQAYAQAVPPNITPVWTGGNVPIDVVLVDAGSDDLFGSAGSGYFPDPNAVLTAYLKLLVTIRTQHPSASIFCICSAGAYGTDRTTLLSMINSAVTTRHGAGDSNVIAFDYFANDPNGWQSYNDASYALNLGAGCQGHPSPAGAAFLAGRLVPSIKAHMGW